MENQNPFLNSPLLPQKHPPFLNFPAGASSKEKKVMVMRRYGEKLVGLLHETRSMDVVILCHSFQSTKDSNTIVNLATALAKAGTTAFRFDFARNTESEGPFNYCHYREDVEDLRFVVEHFYRKNRVISGIVGHGRGGNVALLYASKYNDIRTIVNISGRFDMERKIIDDLGGNYWQRIERERFIDVKTGKYDYHVTGFGLVDLLSIDMHKACLAIGKECRVLIVHGDADRKIPVEDAFKFAKILPNHKLRIIKGANHGYTSHQDKLCEVVLRFIKPGDPASSLTRLIVRILGVALRVYVVVAFCVASFRLCRFFMTFEGED